jgi:hypothetical protein
MSKTSEQALFHSDSFLTSGIVGYGREKAIMLCKNCWDNMLAPELGGKKKPTGMKVGCLEGLDKRGHGRTPY